MVAMSPTHLFHQYSIVVKACIWLRNTAIWLTPALWNSSASCSKENLPRHSQKQLWRDNNVSTTFKSSEQLKMPLNRIVVFHHCATFRIPLLQLNNLNMWLDYQFKFLDYWSIIIIIDTKYHVIITHTETKLTN